MKRGFFTANDGIDASGKGTILNTLVNYEKRLGCDVLDIDEFQKKYDKNPSLKNMELYQTVILSEPSYQGIGKIIREEIIANNKRNYTAKQTAEAFALDRMILFQELILPLLDEGKNVLLSRTVASSLVYQPIQAKEQGEKLTWNYVKNLDGNRFELENSPDLLMIPLVLDPKIVIDRLESREKQDNCIFETWNYQTQFLKVFQSKKLRKLFEKYGTKVEYLDTTGKPEWSLEKNIQETKRKAINIYKKYRV